MLQENKKDKINIDTLTDFDIIELYIKCVEVFVERCTALELSQNRPFELGQVLWKKTVEARNEYRKSHPVPHGT